MKRISLFMFALAGLLALLWFTASAPPRAAAFKHPWELLVATNVAGGEYGLWDDIASGEGGNNEAGLLWFVNNEAGDESVMYKTTEIAVKSNRFPILKARADLSDSAFAYVGYSTATTGNCDYPSALQWVAADARKGYVTKSFTLPHGLTIRMICIWLDDTPDTIATGHSNILIDYISLEKETGEVGWIESFGGAP